MSRNTSHGCWASTMRRAPITAACTADSGDTPIEYTRSLKLRVGRGRSVARGCVKYRPVRLDHAGVEGASTSAVPSSKRGRASSIGMPKLAYSRRDRPRPKPRSARPPDC